MLTIFFCFAFWWSISLFTCPNSPISCFQLSDILWMEEILHHQKDGWNPRNNGHFTIYLLVIRIWQPYPVTIDIIYIYIYIYMYIHIIYISSVTQKGVWASSSPKSRPSTPVDSPTHHGSLWWTEKIAWGHSATATPFIRARKHPAGCEIFLWVFTIFYLGEWII